MEEGERTDHYSLHGGRKKNRFVLEMDNGFRHAVFLRPEIILHATLRLLQLVLALTVAGIYGSGIDSAKKPNGYDVNKWV